MTLSRGSEIDRPARAFSVELIEREPADAYDQARIVITAPTALKDTQLLSWSSGKGDDQQWLVTPRTQRVQRIADRGRQAAFVSSDFSYEDILKWQVDDYDYARAGQGPCPAGTLHDRRRQAAQPLFELHAAEGLLRRRSTGSARSTTSKTAATSPRKTLVHSGYVRQGATLAAVPFGDDRPRDGDHHRDRLVRLSARRRRSTNGS